MGGIISSNNKGSIKVNPTTGEANVNDIVTLVGGGEIEINGDFGEPPYTITFDEEGYPSADISYDNSQSGLISTTVQGAIDESVGLIKTNQSNIDTNKTNITANTSKLTVIEHTISYYSNPNLLDNWYFVNPVNQLGKTQYTEANSRYTIDRWGFNHRNSTATVSVMDDGIKIECTSYTSGSNPIFTQYMKGIPAGTYTISVLCKDVTGTIGMLFEQNYSPWTNDAEITQLQNGLNEVTFTIDGTVREYGLHFHFTSVSTITLVACKLERSNHQTLTHQDSNGNWVLNEIPNYVNELLKCQRYFMSFNYLSTNYYVIGNGVASNSTVVIDIITPVAMYRNPSVLYGGTIRLISPDGVTD